MSFRTCITITVLLLMTVSAGCGKKTSLVPPQKLVPVRITDLHFDLDENGATLRWTYPTELENGDDLRVIENFIIYRAAIPVAEYCPGCPVRFEDQVEIEGGRLPLTGEPKTGVYTDSYLQPGHRYFYKIRSRAGWWYASNDSNVISFVWEAIPQTPLNLKLEPGDGKITLRWDPVEKSSAGNVLGKKPLYQVYRLTSAGEFVAMGEPVHEPEFIDKTVQNEQRYTYQVRALLAVADTLQAGGASQSVSAMPRDLEAPPKPQHLVAVQTTDGIKLVWQAVNADDLAGYRVYRRKGEFGQLEFLGEVSRDQSQFTDLGKGPGGLWFYSVTSFDRSEPSNESEPAKEAVIDGR